MMNGDQLNMFKVMPMRKTTETSREAGDFRLGGQADVGGPVRSSKRGWGDQTDGSNPPDLTCKLSPEMQAYQERKMKMVQSDEILKLNKQNQCT